MFISPCILLHAGDAYEWSDRSAVNYLAWAPGEPNDFDGTQPCVEIYSRSWPGLWNDHLCSDIRPYVCMAEKGTVGIFL